MVDVRETGQAEATVGGELTKDQSEGDGIRAARKGDQQTGARRTEFVSSDGATDLLEKSVHTLPSLSLVATAERSASALRASAGQPSHGLPAVARTLARRAKAGAGGRTRTADPALMRRVL